MRFERSFSVNDNFLDNLDSEAACYFLGFFAADGYLIKYHKNAFGIDLHERDLTTLERIRAVLGYTGPIVTGSRPEMRRLKITSSKIRRALESFGFTTEKTYDLAALSAPIPAANYSHFFRGHTDGDGSWCWSAASRRHRKFYLAWSCRGTPEFCAYLQTLCPVPLNYIFHKTGTLYTKKLASVAALHDWMYTGATIFMDRKRQVRYQRPVEQVVNPT